MIEELFYPEMWDTEMVLQIIDASVFLLFAIAVFYLLLFAIKSIGKSHNVYPKAKKKYKYAVVFPAYKEDAVIVNAVSSIFEQSYPLDKFDVFVVSERMSDQTNKELEELGAVLININFENSTKAVALQECVKFIQMNSLKYDYILLLDADNLVDEYFLDKINDAFYSGCSAIQTHRVAKNYNTNIAILDSVSEEINNSIFRKGHTRFGFSSGLIGSGMAFEYDLFKEYIMIEKNIGVDKHLEMCLLKNGHYIEYLPDIYTYDEKVSKSKQFYNQRKRWISTQFNSFIRGIWGCPAAAIQGNWDYCNKLFQWALPSRVVLLGLLVIISIAYTLVGSMMAIKWWVLLFILCVVFALAIPDYLFNKRLLKAITSLPLIFLMMFVNTITVLFRSNKKFIHTEHYEP